MIDTHYFSISYACTINSFITHLNFSSISTIMMTSPWACCLQTAELVMQQSHRKLPVWQASFCWLAITLQTASMTGFILLTENLSMSRRWTIDWRWVNSWRLTEPTSCIYESSLCLNTQLYIRGEHACVAQNTFNWCWATTLSFSHKILGLYTFVWKLLHKGLMLKMLICSYSFPFSPQMHNDQWMSIWCVPL